MRNLQIPTRHWLSASFEKKIARIILVLLLLTVSCSKPTPVAYQTLDSDELLGTQNSLLNQHNDERKANGKAAFFINEDLNDYAQAHAELMARKNSLYHSSLGFSNQFSTAGENIAMGQRSEKEVVKGWMNSPGHRANILNPRFTDIGFGIAYGPDKSIYWCTCFGG